MNKSIIISIYLLLSFGFITQLEGQTLSNSQSESIKNEVDSVFLRMVGSAEKLDIKELNSGVDDIRIAGFVSNGKYYASYSTLAEKTNKRIKNLYTWQKH
jgi:hypothetical protein